MAVKGLTKGQKSLKSNIYKYDISNQPDFINSSSSNVNNYGLLSGMTGMAGSPLTKGNAGLYSNSRIQGTDYNLRNGISGMATIEDGFQDLSAKSPDMFPAESVASSLVTPYMQQASLAPTSYFASKNTINEPVLLDNNVTSSSATTDSQSRGGLSSLGFNEAYSTYNTDANGNYKGNTGSVASQLDQNRDNAAYGGTYLTADGSYMTKNRFMPDSMVQQTYEQYVAGGGKADEVTWRNSNNDAMRNDNQQFANYAGFGLGAVQTGLGILSYFDNKEMNKKNMKLIDQQLANNQDIMKTRTERAGDIKKYFG